MYSGITAIVYSGNTARIFIGGQLTDNAFSNIVASTSLNHSNIHTPPADTLLKEHLENMELWTQI